MQLLSLCVPLPMMLLSLPMSLPMSLV